MSLSNLLYIGICVDHKGYPNIDSMVPSHPNIPGKCLKSGMICNVIIRNILTLRNVIHKLLVEIPYAHKWNAWNR